MGRDLNGAKLKEVKLNGASLWAANLEGADLNKAKLVGAGLGGVNFSKADLSGADFSKAIVGSTIFGDVDLSSVHGLDTIQHTGPSTIGIDTVYKSKGKIPESFLRGCC